MSDSDGKRIEEMQKRIETLQRERDEAIKWAKYHSTSGSIAMGEEIMRLRTAMRKSMDVMGTSTLSYAILRDALEESDGD